jgi:NADH:ubiquinone oxidoreductase subunit F (NADH-binding)
MSGPIPTAARPMARRSPAGVACLGEPAARLLSGPRTPESLAAHVTRLGAVQPFTESETLLTRLERSGLTGRGGGHFPLWRKVVAARQAGGTPIVVVNVTEGEPASAKDRVLATLRPHLVIDGAVTVAAACGADTIIIAVHSGAAVGAALVRAQAERASAGWSAGLATRVAAVPDRYISGESSALASVLEGGPARPVSRGRPTAEEGINGRPTVVSNAETLAHVALIARRDDEWFRAAGAPDGPGSCLVTLAGDVDCPGNVVELLRPVPAAVLADWACGPDRPWQAVLLGGYTGTWLNREQTGTTILRPGRPPDGQPGIGCGIVAVLDQDRCGLAEAARLLSWLSEERAGQCGACAYGMPLLAAQMEALAGGRSRWRKTSRRVASLAESMSGRGLCSLPDGAVAMAESALEAFAEEAGLHRHRRCRAPTPPGSLPLPDRPGPS